MEPTKVTPMMQQYLQIKERHRDAILLFRLGDFYEMFFEDAHTASKILDIALTSRNKSDDGSVPLCGVPYHSVEPYIQKWSPIFRNSWTPATKSRCASRSRIRRWRRAWLNEKSSG